MLSSTLPSVEAQLKAAKENPAGTHTHVPSVDPKTLSGRFNLIFANAILPVLMLAEASGEDGITEGAVGLKPIEGGNSKDVFVLSSPNPKGETFPRLNIVVTVETRLGNLPEFDLTPWEHSNQAGLDNHEIHVAAEERILARMAASSVVDPNSAN